MRRYLSGRQFGRASRSSPSRGRDASSPSFDVTPSSFSTLRTSTPSSSPSSSQTGSQRRDSFLKLAVTRAPQILSYTPAAGLSEVAYPCDGDGKPIPVDDLLDYNIDHEFADDIWCFCEHVYGIRRPVRIFKPRQGEHEGAVCLGCPDWQLGGVDRFGGPAGCRYFVNLKDKFGGASGFVGVRLAQYPERRDAYISPRRQKSGGHETPSSQGSGPLSPFVAHSNTISGGEISTASTSSAGPSRPAADIEHIKDESDDEYIIPAGKDGRTKQKRKRKIIGPPLGFYPPGDDIRGAQPKRFRAQQGTAVSAMTPRTSAAAGPSDTTAATGQRTRVAVSALATGRPSSSTAKFRLPASGEVIVISSDDDEDYLKAHPPPATRRPLDIARARKSLSASGAHQGVQSNDPSHVLAGARSRPMRVHDVFGGQPTAHVDVERVKSRPAPCRSRPQPAPRSTTAPVVPIIVDNRQHADTQFSYPHMYPAPLGAYHAPPYMPPMPPPMPPSHMLPYGYPGYGYPFAVPLSSPYDYGGSYRADLDRANPIVAPTNHIATDDAATYRAAHDRATIDQAVALDRVVLNRIALDCAALDRAATVPDRASLERAALHRAALERAALEHVALERTAFDHDRAPSGASVECVAPERAAPSRASIDRAAPGQASFMRATLDYDRASLDRAAAEAGLQPGAPPHVAWREPLTGGRELPAMGVPVHADTREFLTNMEELPGPHAGTSGVDETGARGEQAVPLAPGSD